MTVSESTKEFILDMYYNAKDNLVGEHPWDDGYESKCKKLAALREIVSVLGLEEL